MFPLFPGNLIVRANVWARQVLTEKQVELAKRMAGRRRDAPASFRWTCPQCGKPIPASLVNVSEDHARCVSCNWAFRVERVAPPLRLADLPAPPRGSRVSCVETADGVVLHIPRKGMSAADFIVLVSSAIVGAIYVLVTFGMALVVAARSLNQIRNRWREEQIITLGPLRLHVEKKRPAGPFSRSVSYTDIHNAFVGDLGTSNIARIGGPADDPLSEY